MIAKLKTTIKIKTWKCVEDAVVKGQVWNIQRDFQISKENVVFAV